MHLIIVSVVCAGMLAGYGFWYAAVAAKSAAVTSLQNQIDAKTETISRMATTRAALAEIAGDEAAVQKYFVPETGVVAFIDSLESRGRALGVAVDVLSVGKGSSAAPALTFSISVTGTFDAVMRAIGTIEYAPYDISISSLSVVPDEKGRWSAGLTLLVGSVPASAIPHTP